MMKSGPCSKPSNNASQSSLFLYHPNSKINPNPVSGLSRNGTTVGLLDDNNGCSCVVLTFSIFSVRPRGGLTGQRDQENNAHLMKILLFTTSLELAQPLMQEIQ